MTCCTGTFGVRSLLPWWGRIAVKLALSRVPVGYEFWQTLGLFRHGAMDDPEYSLRIFADHWERSSPHFRSKPATALELGPGDSVASALIAHAHGIGSLLLVDTGPYASLDMNTYRRVAVALNRRGLVAPDGDALADVPTMLRACGSTYLTNGLASLEAVPTATVDWIWSQAVLEHVRLAEVERSLAAMRRVIRPGGVISHRIDLQDHLGGGLNNLRFSYRIWERDGFAYRGGFYTNRVRSSEWLRRFTGAGFRVESLVEDRWPHLPIPRDRLASPYRDLPDADLRVRGMNLVLRAA
jgi:SAM-dependent methyltransferase